MKYIFRFNKPMSLLLQPPTNSVNGRGARAGRGGRAAAQAAATGRAHTSRRSHRLALTCSHKLTTI